MAEIKTLEHTTLKVPYEILNKKFRAAQKTIDREISHVNTATSELESCLQEGRTAGEVVSMLEGVVDKLTLLKRKAGESIQDELEAAQSCKKRVEHLQQFESLSPADASIWHRQHLDRLLVDHLLRVGCYKTALKLAAHSDIEHLTNVELFLISKEVEESLERGETAKCLAWCHDNKSKLRKMKSTLEFNLRQQEFIDLIKLNQRMEAIRHARRHFTAMERSQLGEIQRTMVLLALPVNTTISPYKELFDKDRWVSLVHQFRQENFKLYQLSSCSVFTVVLQAGLSALKTPYCYKNEGIERKTDCPVCGAHLNNLARRLPFSHCAQSRLICSISGEILNEHNPPLVLPNGHVYGQAALTSLAAENNGEVTCPRTKQVFNIAQAEKVFVM